MRSVYIGFAVKGEHLTWINRTFEGVWLIDYWNEHRNEVREMEITPLFDI